MKTLMKLALVGCFVALVGCNENKEEAPAAQSAAKTEAAQPASDNAGKFIPVKPREGNRVENGKAVAVRDDALERQEINWAKAKEMNAAGGIYVDVRNPEELREGFVPQSLNIPVNELKHRLSELPTDKDILIYCRSGNRSRIAVRYLLTQGYTRVYTVQGGFKAYTPAN